jgi:hypothetical protein
MPLIATRGAASVQGFGEFAQAAAPAIYIEDVFSTYLYTGNGSAQLINNNILLGSGSVATNGIVLSQGGSGVFPASDGSYAVITENSVSKINANNTVAWTKSDNNKTFNNVRIDSSGNVYVVCYNGSTVFVAKYNSSGTAQWIVSTGSSVTPDDVIGIAITSDGNLFLGWGSNGGVSMKMSSADGSITWQKSITGTSVKLQDVCADSSGNCYQLIYSGSTRVNNVIKFDSSGNTTWQKEINSSDGTGGFFCYGIGVDSSLNVYVNAYINNVVTNKNFIYKLDSNGLVVAQRGWPATPSLGAATALCVDASNNVYVTMNNGFVIKYNSSLSLQWVRNLNISAGRRGLNPNTTDVFYMSEGSVVVKLALDGSTNQGVSTSGTINYYSPPFTDASTSAVSSTNSSFTISSSAYSSSSTTFANDYSITGTALTFPEIEASDGGAVWIKGRSVSFSHRIGDTARGATKRIIPNSTDAQDDTGSQGITSFASSGFSIGNDIGLNQSSATYVSWTFRKQPKFFDVVTYTGNGASNRQIAHNLGSTPGCIIVKCTSTSASWAVWHRFIGSNQYLYLNSTIAATTDNTVFGGTPNATNFTVAGGGANVATNQNGATYVAYLFAHDAGGFGDAGTDNVITCGSFTADGTTQEINLGFEPQWMMFKSSSNAQSWYIGDVMRGATASGATQTLFPNLSNAEVSDNLYAPTATGFKITPSSAIQNTGYTYIYIAIRRGPMKTPTSGTSVFTPSTRAGTGATATTSNLSFPPDMVWSKGRDNGGTNSGDFDRLRGATKQLSLNQADSETTASTSLTGFDVMTGYAAGADAVQLTINASGYNYVNWQFRRAPGFFDVVCDTGTGSTHTIAHNLGVVPELMIRKSRSQSSTSWYCYVASEGASRRGFLNSNAAWGGPDNSIWGGTTPTSTVFTVGADGNVNNNTSTYVTYLFASLSGVSKIGTYTGTGALQTVNCGFTGGSRFVLIKRTDSTGDWYVYDSARGISSGNDPYLFVNSTAAEVTGTNYVDTTSVGFQVTAAAPAGLNSNGGTYIFLAIA